MAAIFVSGQKKFTIVLDAGHGDSDTGATRAYDFGRVQEKDVTLGIVLKLGRMLEQNKAFHVIYTRKTDVYPSLTERTTLANRSKADLFLSVHVNSSPGKSTESTGTETFVQGPAQNRENLEVAKKENDVIYLDATDKEILGSYDPTSPESLIALKIQQAKYQEKSLLLGSLIEDGFEKSGRYSRGVKQANLHVLRMAAMPSVLIETGFVNNYDDAVFLYSEEGQQKTANLIYDALQTYMKRVKAVYTPEPPKKEEKKESPLKNNFRILLMSAPVRYATTDPALKGLKDVLIIKEGGNYKYFFGQTNYASLRDANLKTAQNAGFRNAYAVGFVPNQQLMTGYYTLELYSGRDKLENNSIILSRLKDVKRVKENGMFSYTYGQVKSLEDAISLQNSLARLGITNTVIQKVLQ